MSAASSGAAAEPLSATSPKGKSSPFAGGPGRGQSSFLGQPFDQRRARRTAILVLIAGLVLTGVIVGSLGAARARSQQRALTLTTVRAATDLQTHIRAAAASLLTAVTWVLEAGGPPPAFKEYTQVLLPAYPGLLGLQLAPETVVREVAPVSAVPKLGWALGRNALHDPLLRPAVSGAIEHESLWFGPPARLDQGTVLLPASVPIRLPDQSGQPAFWGVVNGLFDLEKLVAMARIDQLPAGGWAYTLRAQEANGAPLGVIKQTGQPPSSAQRQLVELSGLRLELAVWPRRPEPSWWWALLASVPGVALAFIASLLVGTLGRSRQAAAAATAALGEASRQKKRLNRLLNSFPDPVLLTLADGRIADANRAAREMFGYSQGELLGRPISQLLPHAGPEPEETGPALKLGVAGGRTRARHQDGRWIPVVVEVTPIDPEDQPPEGSPTHCVVIRRPRGPGGEPATELSPADSPVFLASPVPMLLLRQDLQIIAGNGAAARLLGVRGTEQLVRRNLAEFTPPRQRDGVDTAEWLGRQVEMALRDGQAVSDMQLQLGERLSPARAAWSRLSDPNVPLLLALIPADDVLRLTEQLVELENRLRAIQGGLRDWETWMGLDGQPLWIGGPVETFTGCTAEECLAMPDYPFPLIHPEDHERVREALAGALQGTKGSNLEFRIRRKDGQIRRVTMAWQPVFDARRRPLGYRLSIRDASHARAVTEDDPTERRDTVELALDAADIGVWDWDLLTGQNVWDERMLRLFGLSPEAFGRSHDAWCQRVHPEDRERLEAAIQTALETEEPYAVEHRVCLPDGSVRFLASRGRVIRDTTGRPIRLVGATWDVTHLRQTEEALLEEQALLRNLLDHTRALIHARDAEGRLFLANRAWLEFHGIATEESPDSDHTLDIPPELDRQLLAADAEVARSLQPRFAVETRTSGARDVRLLADRFPLLDGSERLQAVVCLALPLPEFPEDPGDQTDQESAPPSPPEPPASPAPSSPDAESPAASGQTPPSAPTPQLAQPPHSAPSEDLNEDARELLDTELPIHDPDTPEPPIPAEPPTSPEGDTPTAQAEPSPTRPSRPRKRARRPAPPKKQPAASPTPRQEQLFPLAEEETSPAPSVQLAHVAEEMGLSAEEAADRLAAFSQLIQRNLRDLKEALEDGRENEARELAHTVAEAAAEHSAPELRRAAKTVELAIRYQESRLPAMVAELETEVARTVSVIETLTAPPAPAVEPLRVSRAILDTLDQLATNLEEEDGEAALEGIDTLLDQALPEELGASLREIRELVAEAEWPEALSRIRGWIDRLGSAELG